MPAEADPQLAAEAAKALADIYSAAQVELLAAIARHTAAGIDTPGWASRQAAQLAQLEAEARARIVALASGAADTAGTVIGDAWAAGTAAGGVELGEAGINLTWGTINREAVERLAGELTGRLAATHLQILRSTLDDYRRVVADTTAQAVTGTWTTRQAAQRALDRLADRGITGFVDTAGRRWGLDSYVEMATRTATGRAQVAGTLDRFQAAGRDLVVVSDHTQECSLCRPWEGRVLSISGRTAGYPTVAEATAGGLLHANCRHVLGLWVPGLSEPIPGPTADPEGDLLRQRQRYLERGVRRWKRREATAITAKTHRYSRAKRIQWQEALDDHVERHGLKRLRYRESLRLTSAQRAEVTRAAEIRAALAAKKLPVDLPVRKFRTDAEGIAWARKHLGVPAGETAELDALRTYGGSGHKAINELLRGLRPAGSQTRALVRQIDEAMLRTSLPEPVTLYRGTTLAALPDLPDQIVGRKFREPGFMSTSIGAGPAWKDEPVQMEIIAPRGTRAVFMQPLQSTKGLIEEREVLLDRNQDYVVLEAAIRNGKWWVKMEILP
ncbi:MAG: hypothetical protein KJ056_11020 [Acidimicrobiia bacterium]|nr:hypothetical protein [Acidimicrobiia bacterium]